MEFTSQREVRLVDPSWSLAELMSHLTQSLENSAPALALTKCSATSVSSDIALIVATSGSTGEAKEVGLTAQALRASAKASNKFLGATSGARWSLLLPLTHIAGVNVLLRSIELSTTPIDLREHTGTYPQADFTSIVPTQLFRALNGDAELLNHLQEAKAVVVGGAALSSQLRAQADAVGIKIIESYGMTETCGGCIYDGKPLEGVGLQLTSDGLIQISGKTLANGYVNDETSWSSKFDGHWFTTSDQGLLSNNGLKIIGRTDDVIISGGENLSLLAVENVISKYLPHLDFAVYVKENPEWGQQLFLVLAAGSNTSENEIRELLEKELGEIAKPKGFIYLPSIPRSALGKVDRATLERQVDDE